jgi:hypothetical protein
MTYNVMTVGESPECLASFELLKDGTVEATYNDPEFSADMDDGIYSMAAGGVVAPKDGKPFIDALLLQFRASVTTVVTLTE